MTKKQFYKQITGSESPEYLSMKEKHLLNKAYDIVEQLQLNNKILTDRENMAVGALQKITFVQAAEGTRAKMLADATLNALNNLPK